MAVARSAAIDLADTFVKVDDFAPVRPCIDPTDASAFRALEVCGDIVPIPFRQVVKFLCCPVMAARALRRPDAINEDGFEAVSLGALWSAARPIAQS